MTGFQSIKTNICQSCGRSARIAVEMAETWLNKMNQTFALVDLCLGGRYVRLCVDLIARDCPAVLQHENKVVFRKKKPQRKLNEAELNER